VGFTADEIKKVLARFDVIETIQLRGVTVIVAQEVLAFCDEGRAKVPKEEAKLMVDRLLDFYGHQKFKSADAATAFSAAVTALVTEVSHNAARRAFHPVTGLPRKEEFLSVANVARALEAEEARYYRIAANARWVISQREAAEKAAKEETEIEASKGTAEVRAARVAELMAGLRATANGA
jgi:hypothetical protein